ncbi:cyclin-dependent kinase 2-interacting protein-like [Coccinella septempunctata]|uniref:cyclin-dependent kinase 2-interacting protein-like n=1 Tax=Coccinella septempunctata TaxID=41139 RepID=UPI001D089723|nr:cyclin-dependent kinase 2-interacting protein-like [Coccinella septempunctata]
MDLFSPVTVKQSPVVTTPGKNLTGSPRIARDTVADIHNFIQKWNTYHIEGIKIVEAMVNLLPRDLKSSNDDLLDSSFNLYILVEKCSEVIEALELFHERIKALTNLMSEEEILFTTLHLGDMVKHARTIHEAYMKELANKRLVLEHISFVKSVSEAVFLKCLWKYQTDVNRDVRLALEILLVETGHRAIT